MENREEIIKLAEDLDSDLETQDIQKLLPYFAEDCVIELFGLSLTGLKGVERWLNWFFNMFETIEFEPIVIIVEKNVFFEEFWINVTFNNGETLRAKVAEVLVYKNNKITSLRLYLDRLQFAEASLKGGLRKSLVRLIKKKSVEGLI